jgi:hypothetical protein
MNPSPAAAPAASFLDRCRAFGQARLEAIAQIRSRDDWQRLWAEPAHAFPFAWGPCWKATIEIRVAGFPAELGFYIDVLGFASVAVGSDFALLETPDHAFGISVVPCGTAAPTPPEAISIQFMVADIQGTITSLRARGVPIAQEARPEGPGSPLHTAVFLTPNGHRVKLWGLVQATA